MIPGASLGFEIAGLIDGFLNDFAWFLVLGGLVSGVYLGLDEECWDI